MTQIYESAALQDTLNSVKENCINSIKAILSSAGFAYVKLDNPIVCEHLTNGESSTITHIDVANESFVVEGEITTFDMAFTFTNVQVLIDVLEAIEEGSYEEEKEEGE